MGKVIGIFLVLGGIAGGLYQWTEVQRERQKRIEEFALFLHKSIYAMETEKIKVVDYFSKYISQDSRITEFLHEIAARLSQNIYPKGQEVWEDVLKEKEQEWNLDKETFGLILKSGNGFFGQSRAENISLLQKQLQELEKEQFRIKEKDAREKKLWVPVSMLSGIMLVILFL